MACVWEKREAQHKLILGWAAHHTTWVTKPPSRVPGQDADSYACMGQDADSYACMRKRVVGGRGFVTMSFAFKEQVIFWLLGEAGCTSGKPFCVYRVPPSGLGCSTEEFLLSLVGPLCGILADITFIESQNQSHWIQEETEPLSQTFSSLH